MKKNIISFAVALATGFQASLVAQNFFPLTGNVGIGTTIPQADLHLRPTTGLGAGRSQIRVDMTGTEDGSPNSLLVGAAGPQFGGIGFIDTMHAGVAAPTPLSLRVNGSEAVRIAPDGRVGIGIVVPQAKLSVAGDIRAESFSTPPIQASVTHSLGLVDGVVSSTERPLYNAQGYFSSLFKARFSQEATGLAFSVINGDDSSGLRKAWIDSAGHAGFAGNVTADGRGIFGTVELTCDRNVKQDVQSVLFRDIVTKVAALPVTTWSYTNSPTVRHVGPMAQDFKAAFPEIGEDDKHIGAGDGIGVALAAIKGLHELVQEKDTEIANLRRELLSMKQELVTANITVTDRLASLEKALSHRNEQQAGALPEAAR